VRFLPGPQTLLATAIYIALAVIAFWPVAPWSNTTILATSPHDSVSVGWYLNWVPFAITHGHNPFFSPYLESPDGVNLATNTSMPILGLVMTPFASLFGPLGMINLVMRLTFVASALSMYLVAKRYTTRLFPAFLAGLFYGFSPTIVAHNLENPNFSFLPALPVLFLLVDRLFNPRTDELRVANPSSQDPRPQSARRIGVWLGVVGAVQIYLNPEVLAETVVVLAVAEVVVTVVRVLRRRSVPWRRLGEGLVAAGVVLLVLGMPFLYYYFAGPQHLTGTVVPLQYLTVFHSDLLAPLLPNRDQLLASTTSTANLYTGGAINETGTYLGIPLLCALVAFVVLYRRVTTVVLAGLAVVVAFVFSLGPDLFVNNHDTGIAMPARLLLHLPALSSAETVRYFIAGDLAVAFILVIACDRLLTTVGEWRERRGSRRGWLWSGVVMLCFGAVLVPLIPRWPYPFVSTTTPGSPITSIPPYFTSRAVDAIRPGTVAMTYPLPQSGATAPELWQLAANFRFRLVWGYAYIADSGGVIQGNTPFRNGLLPSIEGWAFGNSSPLTPPPKMTISALKDVRAGFAQFHNDEFLLQDVGNHPDVVTLWVSAALGERPVDRGGILAWYHVERQMKMSMKGILGADRARGILAKYPPPGVGA
jgi:hypothetical protein